MTPPNRLREGEGSGVAEDSAAPQVQDAATKAVNPDVDAAQRAFTICSLLANTDPKDWLSKERIHLELAEFRGSKP